MQIATSLSVMVFNGGSQSLTEVMDKVGVLQLVLSVELVLRNRTGHNCLLQIM